MKNERHSFKQNHQTFSALFIMITFFTVVMPKTANASKPNTLNSNIETLRQDDFDKKFRQARDLIDNEQWAKAAEKFGEIVERYPDNKSADVALYWLAFCYKKQKNYQEADAALNRLIERFPASSWVSDARVMKMEIAPPLGKIYSASLVATKLSAISGLPAAAPPLNDPKLTTGNPPPQFNSYPGFAVATPPIPLDREDEIKIAAFQSLLAADPKRAIEALGELFKADSKASDVFKQEALRVLRRPRVWQTSSVSRTASSVNQNYEFSTGGEKINKQFLPLLRDTLLKGFQTERSVKIRKEIIYAFSTLGDDQSSDELARLYAAESEPEIKKAIIRSLSGATSGFSTAFAYNSGVYTNSVSISTDGDKNSGKGFDKLLEIIRAEKDIELRRLAFSTLRGFAGWSAREGIIEMFSQMYETETDEQFKISIIHSLAESRQNKAEMKLLDIARKDKSDKLRLEAIRSLETSKNPEVLKFLEDLIK